MNRIFTLSLSLALCASVSAESVKILTLGLGTPGIDEPQLMGLGISPDGKYACGSIEMGTGYFVADIESGQYTWAISDDPEGAELRHVNNFGLAIGYNGPGVTYSIDGVETILPTPDGDYKYVLGEDLSDDGTVMVGSIVAKGFVTYAAISRDGSEWTMLPMPDDDQLGDYAGDGSAAKYVSGNGSVILGNVGSFGPGIIWKLNESGEYDIDPLFSKYVIWDDEDTCDKELYSLLVLGLSNNGRYAVCRGTVLTEEGLSMVPVVYDVEEQELTIYSEPQDIDGYGLGLTPTAIDNNGTVIGVIGQPMSGASGSFILKPGETQARTFAEVFPQYAEIFGFSEMIGYTVPTGMSADGRYILGYGYYSEDFYDEEIPAYFSTYVIDTLGTSGLVVVPETSSDAVPEAYYTVDGKRLSAPVKGVNIVRMSDGTARKVIVR